MKQRPLTNSEIEQRARMAERLKEKKITERSPESLFPAYTNDREYGLLRRK